MDHPFSPAEFKEIFSRVPRLCVDLVIRTPQGVILTLRTLPTWHNQWHFPGGTVHYKETIAHAARRVAKSEVGVEIVVLKTLGYMEFPSEEKERGFGWSVSIALLCEITSGELLKKTAEASDMRAFRELPENTMAEHRSFLTEHWNEIREGSF